MSSTFKKNFIPENPYPEFDYWITIENRSYYYSWMPENNKKIERENFNWNGAFELSPLYRVTHNGLV